MKAASLVRLYPGWWRARYGEEMDALLAADSQDRRDIVDLARGALDAWLHPTSPSWLPAAAALVGGGLWTTVAAATLAQPSPLDWPGYLIELVPIALVAAVALLVAVLGCALRLGDRAGRAAGLAAAVVVAGSVAWIGAMAFTIAGMADPVTLAASQTVAMLGVTGIGLLLIRASDEVVGGLLLVGSVAMLIPWAAGWLAFGATWTCIGIYLVTERVTRARDDYSRS